MSTITKEFTKEQLIAKAQEQIKLTRGLNLTLSAKDHVDMCSVLFEIALASLEAEAAYFINRVKHSDAYGDDVELRTYCYELDALKSKDDFGGEVVPVYTAPPAPVSVPDAMEMDDDFDSAFEHGKAVGWNAYRAAMLQSFGNSEQLNSPVIQDGWVACSERMPEDEQEVITHNIFGYRHVSFFDEHSGHFFDRLDGSPVDCVEHVLVSHWMPLPASPQQEVKS